MTRLIFATGLLTAAVLTGCSQPVAERSAAHASASAPVAALPHAAASLDTGGKQLESIKGDVSFEAPRENPSELAPRASILLPDTDYALTGAASLGTLRLPDSSVITLGATTRVQLASFNQAAVTTARFIVVNGTLRFSIHHPHGAIANYTFVTPTAQIAVRGTEGDIAVEGDRLQVNVYQLSDPKLPVLISVNGSRKRITLPAGKTLTTRPERGRIRTDVTDVSRASMARFNRQFGVPRGVAAQGKPAHPSAPHPQKAKASAAPKVHPHTTANAHAKPTPQPRKKPHLAESHPSKTARPESKKGKSAVARPEPTERHR